MAVMLYTSTYREPEQTGDSNRSKVSSTQELNLV